jgi:putative DNA primase/helicase
MAMDDIVSWTNFVCTTKKESPDPYMIPAKQLASRIASHQGGEAYQCAFDLEKRPTFVDYKGLARPALGLVKFDFDDKGSHGALALTQGREFVYEDLEAAKHFQIFFSGSKGFDISIPAEMCGLEHPDPFLQAKLKSVAVSLKKRWSTVDTSVYLPAQKFRLPRSRHDETGLYKIWLSLDQFLSLSMDEIRALAETRGPIWAPPTPGGRAECWLANLVKGPEIKESITPQLGAEEEESESEAQTTPPGATAPTSSAPPEYPKPDNKAVLSGCEFLKRCGAAPQALSEAEWYAMLSITGRLENGRELSHKMSEGHPGYSPGETDRKLDQALAASGPRTCENIDGIGAGDCDKCAFKGKVKSPIAIQGPDYIKTEHTGFHTWSEDKDGKPCKPKPCYEDLRRYFERERGYKVLGPSKICYTWNGKMYVELPKAYLENFAYEHFRPFAESKARGEFADLVSITNMVEPDWWSDTTLRKMNFQNGVLDLDTMELLPHDSARGFRHILSYSYDPQAKCPVFDQFMKDIMCGDMDKVAVLEEFMGYSISNDECWMQKSLLLEGEGENGKSTFIDVLKELAGRGNYTALLMNSLNKDTHRQMLDGKLFNISEETPTKSLVENSTFKNLVSGGETQVKRLYKDPYTMTNRAKIIFACNELPEIRDTTHGFFRRLLLIQFKATFSAAKGNHDPFIKEKLLAELPGIFNRVMAGYQRLRRNKGFSKSADADHALSQYKVDSDTVMAWYQDNVQVVEPTPGGEHSEISDLFAEYVQVTKSKELEPVNNIVFGKRLKRLVPDYDRRFDIQRRKKDGRCVRLLYGVIRYN